MSNTTLELILNKDQIKTLDSMVEVCEFKNKEELINNALIFFNWAIGEVGKGNKIASYEERTRTRHTASLPGLKAAAKNLSN